MAKVSPPFIVYSGNPFSQRKSLLWLIGLMYFVANQIKIKMILIAHVDCPPFKLIATA